MNKDDTKQAIIGFMEFTKGITGNKDLKIPEDIAKEYGIEQEPCKDTISRQAVLGLAYDLSEIDGEHFTEPCMVVDVEDIQKLSPVTPKQRTGHWINTADPRYSDNIVCNLCGFDSMWEYDFCPKCGAKMVEPQESEGKDGNI